MRKLLMVAFLLLLVVPMGAQEYRLKAHYAAVGNWIQTAYIDIS